MAIQFIGHTPNYSAWAFNINGKKFIGRNLSTETPFLSLRWDGYLDDAEYNRIGITSGWVKPEAYGSSGFAITSSTGTTVEWVWRGIPYRSNYQVEVNEDDNGDPYYHIYFGTPVNLQQLAANAARVAEEARLKQAEADRQAAEARARQVEADKAAAEAKVRRDQAAAEEARRKQEDADRASDESKRKQEEAAKAEEVAKNAKAEIAPAGTDWLGVVIRVGSVYGLIKNLSK
jgi:hypothetical protein